MYRYADTPRHTAVYVSWTVTVLCSAHGALLACDSCVQCGEIDHAYIARAYHQYGSELKLLHPWGCRHLADVATIEGITIPPKPIFCRACVEGKYTHLSLNKKRVDPL